MTVQEAKALRHQGRHEEARALLVQLCKHSPQDAELNYATACVHDFLSLEAEAVPYYRAALAGDLSAESRQGAFLGLGSTYRTLGQYAAAHATLTAGVQAFPQARELQVFLAMTLYNLGDAKAAVQSLLVQLAQTSCDKGIQAYQGAIELYAGDIDRVWPENGAKE